MHRELLKKSLRTFINIMLVMIMLATLLAGLKMPEILVQRREDSYVSSEFTEELDTVSVSGADSDDYAARIVRIRTVADVWDFYHTGKVSYSIEPQDGSFTPKDTQNYASLCISSYYGIKKARDTHSFYLCVPKEQDLSEIYKNNYDSMKLYRTHDTFGQNVILTTWVDPEVNALIYMRAAIDLDNFSSGLYRTVGDSEVGSANNFLMCTSAALVSYRLSDFAKENGMSLDYLSSNVYDTFRGLPVKKLNTSVDDTEDLTYYIYARDEQLYIFYRRIYEKKDNNVTIFIGFSSQEPKSE